MKVCSICQMPNRLEIDKALLSGKTIAAVSLEFGGISRDALSNHRQKHISKRLATLTQRREAAENLDIRNELENMITRIKDILTYAEKNKQHSTFLKATAELRCSFELLLKIAVAIHDTEREDLKAKEEFTQAKNDAEFQKKLGVLTVSELKMFLALQEKVLMQSKRTILPNSEITVLGSKITNSPYSYTTVEPIIEEVAEKPSKTDNDIEFEDHLHADDTIPSTPWRESPLNTIHLKRKEKERQKAMDDPEVLEEIKKFKR